MIMLMYKKKITDFHLSENIRKDVIVRNKRTKTIGKGTIKETVLPISENKGWIYAE